MKPQDFIKMIECFNRAADIIIHTDNIRYIVYAEDILYLFRTRRDILKFLNGIRNELISVKLIITEDTKEYSQFEKYKILYQKLF